MDIRFHHASLESLLTCHCTYWRDRTLAMSKKRARKKIFVLDVGENGFYIAMTIIVALFLAYIVIMYILIELLDRFF